jgi:hypothetical protein
MEPPNLALPAARCGRPRQARVRADDRRASAKHRRPRACPTAIRRRGSGSRPCPACRRPSRQSATARAASRSARKSSAATSRIAPQSPSLGCSPGSRWRRSTRLHHLQSCGTLERCDASNDRTTRRYWSRHLGLHHCHRSMRRLPRGSPFQATSRGRSSPWTTPNFRGCSRPLPSRSIAANKALPRTKRLGLSRLGRHHGADLGRSAIRPEGLTGFRREQQISFGRRSGRGSSRRPLPARFEYPSPW